MTNQTDIEFGKKLDKISNWFQAWANPDWNNFSKVFADDVYYSESWGPEYQGIDQLRRWHREWFADHKLDYWTVTSLSNYGNRSYLEWKFACSNEGEKAEFDGISIIEWDADQKIASWKEFASSLPKYNPLTK